MRTDWSPLFMPAGGTGMVHWLGGGIAPIFTHLGYWVVRGEVAYLPD